MTLVLGLIAGCALLLFVSGLPIGNRGVLSRRVDPFVMGSRRRGISTADGHRRWALRKWLPSGDEQLQRRLRASGTGLTESDLRLEQLVWAAAGGAVALGIVILGAAAGSVVAVLPGTVLIVVCSTIGGAGRDWYLSRQIATRREALISELPTAIDLVTIAVMSGESIAGAVARVARLMTPGVGDEFADTTADVRSGMPLTETLEGLSRRFDDPTMGRFVDALCTAIDRGAPLAEVLRAQADDLREAGRRRILEIGGRREVWMLVPVVFLIMPVVVVFALLPGLASLDLLVP